MNFQSTESNLPDPNLQIERIPDRSKSNTVKSVRIDANRTLARRIELKIKQTGNTRVCSCHRANPVSIAIAAMESDSLCNSIEKSTIRFEHKSSGYDRCEEFGGSRYATFARYLHCKRRRDIRNDSRLRNAAVDIQ